MPRTRTRFSTLRIASLGIMVCAAGTAVHAQAPADSPAALPEVLVEGQRAALKQRVEAFVRTVTENPGLSADDSLVRWDIPMCLLAVGFSEADGSRVSSRLAQIASLAGAPLARAPCPANFVIVATSEPERVLAAWYAKDSHLFGDAALADIRRFLGGPQTRPVRVWRNLDRGRIASMRYGHFRASNEHAQSSPFIRNSVVGFFSVFAIIDTARALDVSLDQLSDYVAMAGLSDIDLDADMGSASSILRLFAAPAQTRLAALSDWDLAFLKALYQTDHTSKNQRFEIAQRVLNELSH